MLFNDTELSQTYAENGFVVLPLIGEETLRQLQLLYQQNYPQEMVGLQPSLRIGDAQKNIALHHQIGKLLSPSLENWFTPFAFNANHFIAKGAKAEHEFELHQDWNVVDETKYSAAHIWIALQDIDEQNGGLFLVSGSHHFFDTVRSGSCGIPFIKATEKVKPYITSPSIKAGEAIVYQQALFHGSYPNRSSQVRLVCLCSVRPKEASMLYYQQQDSTTLAYEISPEILFEQVKDLEQGVAPQTHSIPVKIEQKPLPTHSLNNPVFEARLTYKEQPNAKKNTRLV